MLVFWLYYQTCRCSVLKIQCLEISADTKSLKAASHV